jgi:hypothetical protein
MRRTNTLLLSLLAVGCSDQRERFLVNDPDLDAVVESLDQDAGAQDFSDAGVADLGVDSEFIVTYRAIFNSSGEQGSIVTIGLDSGEEGRLDFDNDFYSPVISKDGKFIVAAASVNGGSYNPILDLDDFHGIGVFNLQGEMVGTTRRRNLLANNPAFSDDSNRVAYVEKKDGNDFIRVVRINDEGEIDDNRLIGEFESSGFLLNYDLGWAGESKLAFYKTSDENNARRLYFVNLNNNLVRGFVIGENERGFNRTNGADFFNEGRYFVTVMDTYVDGRVEDKAVSIVSSNGEEVNPIFDLQTNNYSTYVSICPDERTVVFVYDSPAGSGDYRIERINVDGSGHDEVTKIEVASDQFGIGLDHFSCRENNLR